VLSSSVAKPSIAVFFHFFPPDDTVAAVLFGDLCSGLADRGWQVSAHPCVWSSDEEATRFPSRDTWREISVRRIWRPNLRQSSTFGRFLNAVWMIVRWSVLAMTLRPRPDVLLVGTDPILSVSVAFFWNLFSPRTKIAHWCFDLYPEAAIADGLLPVRGLPARLSRRLMRSAYRRCALIVDLGPCMRRLLLRYPSKARRETIVPWAINEPDLPLPVSASERALLFAEAPLALLYSGGFGRAHSYEEILDLAELLQPHGGKLVFSVRGKRQMELRQAVNERNAGVEFVAFTSQDKLQDRLACADVHVVTLRSAWTGTVVPSKFFGALSAGRPILFAGAPESSLAQWIREFRLGWVLTGENLQQVCRELLDYAGSSQKIDAMQQHCFAIYRRQFSRQEQIDRWDRCLKSLLGRPLLNDEVPGN
jgi:colanic acid biosynthesis glycosyl transferase WcaI